MSLFDVPKQEKLSDVFPINTLFWLISASYEGLQPTEYGQSHQATIVACPVAKPDDIKPFRVWGTLAEQVKAVGEDDLPAEVEVTKDGRRNVFRFSKHLESTDVPEITNVNVADDEETPF